MKLINIYVVLNYPKNLSISGALPRKALHLIEHVR